MEEPRDAATSGDAFTYAYKSSLMGAPFEFRLTLDALEWRRGETKGHTAYRRIHRVRLGFRPMTMQNHRFLAEIWGDGPKLMIASTSWKSLVEHQRLDAPYRAFVTELCRRIDAAGGQTMFRRQRGNSCGVVKGQSIAKNIYCIGMLGCGRGKGDVQFLRRGRLLCLS